MRTPQSATANSSRPCNSSDTIMILSSLWIPIYSCCSTMNLDLLDMPLSAYQPQQQQHTMMPPFSFINEKISSFSSSAQQRQRRYRQWMDRSQQSIFVVESRGIGGFHCYTKTAIHPYAQTRPYRHCPLYATLLPSDEWSIDAYKDDDDDNASSQQTFNDGATRSGKDENNYISHQYPQQSPQQISSQQLQQPPLNIQRAKFCAENPGQCSVDELMALTIALEKIRRAVTTSNQSRGYNYNEKMEEKERLEENAHFHFDSERISSSSTTSNTRSSISASRGNALEQNLIRQLYELSVEHELMEEDTRMEYADLGRGRNDMHEMIKEENLNVINLREEWERLREEEEEEEAKDRDGGFDWPVST